MTLTFRENCRVANNLQKQSVIVTTGKWIRRYYKRCFGLRIGSTIDKVLSLSIIMSK